MKNKLKSISIFLLFCICLSLFIGCKNIHKDSLAAVIAATEAFYLDRDAEDYFEASLSCDIDFLENNKNLLSEEEYSKLKEEINSNRQKIEVSLVELDFEYEDKDVEIAPYYTENPISKDSEEWDAALFQFIYRDTALTDLVEEICEIEYTLKVNGDIADSTMLVYRIGDSWYIG